MPKPSATVTGPVETTNEEGKENIPQDATNNQKPTDEDKTKKTGPKTGKCLKMSEEEFQLELTLADNKNTLNQEEKAITAFNRAMEVNTFEIKNIWEMTQKELDRNLGHFYLGARTNKDDFYKLGSMEAFRHALVRVLAKNGSDFNIKDPKAFPDSNKAWKAMSKKLKQAGKAVVEMAQEITEEGTYSLTLRFSSSFKHNSTLHTQNVTKNDFITRLISDRLKIYSHPYMDPSLNAAALQRRVQFNLHLFLLRRGRENIENLKFTDFRTEKEPKTGLWLVTKITDEETKNHKGNELDKDTERGVMPEFPDDKKNCPVFIFEQYRSHRNPRSEFLFTKPRQSINVENDVVWYTTAKMGKNKFSTFMQEVSKNCGLSKIYRNHDCRATGISLLSRLQYSPAHIMSASGQKSVNTVARYSRVSMVDKLAMASTLGQAMTRPEDHLDQQSTLQQRRAIHQQKAEEQVLRRPGLLPVPLTWDEAHPPQEEEEPEITAIYDEHGNNLLDDPQFDLSPDLSFKTPPESPQPATEAEAEQPQAKKPRPDTPVNFTDKLLIPLQPNLDDSDEVLMQAVSQIESTPQFQQIAQALPPRPPRMEVPNGILQAIQPRPQPQQRTNTVVQARSANRPQSFSFKSVGQIHFHFHGK